jgi:hypothetical protein
MKRPIAALFLAALLAYPIAAQCQTVICCGSGTGGSGTGTVTSVDATVPTYMAVTGNPITTSGTLAFSFTSQAQNLMFASPNGSAGVPLFRALVAADLPATIDSDTTGNAATATSATTAGTATSAGTAATATALAANPTDCGVDEFANAIDASGNLTCAEPAGGGGGSTLPVADTTSIVEGSADATKELRFEVDGIATGTTIVATPPTTSFTMARTDAAQTFTGVQTFTSAPTAPVGVASNQLFGTITTPTAPTQLTSFGSTIACGLAGASGPSQSAAFGDGVTCTGTRRNTLIGSGAFSNANDCTRLGFGGGCTGTGSVAVGSGSTVNSANSMIFTTGGGGGGLSNPVAQSILFAGIDADVTNFTVGDGHTSGTPSAVTFRTTSGTGTNIAGATMVHSPGSGTGTGRGGDMVLQTSPSTTSGTTTGTPVDRYRAASKAVALTSGVGTNIFEISLPALGTAGVTFTYQIFATDGTDVQSLSGTVTISAVNKAGVITSGFTESSTSAVSTGTLSAVWSGVSGTNKVSVRVTPTSSLTATSFGVYYQVQNNSTQTITPL